MYLLISRLMESLCTSIILFIIVACFFNLNNRRFVFLLNNLSKSQKEKIFIYDRNIEGERPEYMS